jgi:hypothetical protein
VERILALEGAEAVAVVAAVGGGAFVLACLVLGARLLFLALRTRELPEFCIGAGLFLMGGVGYPLMMLARFHTELDGDLRSVVAVTHLACSLTGNVAVCVFNWRVFRPDSAAAKGLTVAVSGTLIGLFIAQGLSPGFLAFAQAGEGPWAFATYFTSFAYAWAGTESTRYFLMMSKRGRLGLADPVVTDRFRLWAIGTLSAVVISAVGIIYRALGLDFQGSAVGGITIGSLGLVTAICFWLAFLPPAFYRRRVGGSPGDATATA